MSSSSSSYKSYRNRDNLATISTSPYRPSYSITSGTYKVPKTIPPMNELINKYSIGPTKSKNETSGQKDKTSPGGKADTTSKDKSKSGTGPPITYNTRVNARTTAQETAVPTKPTPTRVSKIATYDRTLTGTQLKKAQPTPIRAEPVQQNYLAVKNFQRGPSPATNRSRDPSPATSNRNSYTFQDVQKQSSGSYSRSTSPNQLSYNRYTSGRSISRETSPLHGGVHSSTAVLSKFLTVKQGRSREPSPTSKYSSPGGYTSHRYDHKLKSSPTLSITPNPSISYMTSSEVSQALKARSTTRSRTRSSSSSVTDSPVETHHTTSYESTSKEIQKISAQIEALCNGGGVGGTTGATPESRESSSETTTSSTTDSDDVNSKKTTACVSSSRLESDTTNRIKPKIMVKIDVVHRATSPTHPYQPSQMTNLATTVEQSILRPYQPDAILIDSAMQSNRVDDSARCVKVIYAPTYSPLTHATQSKSTSSPQVAASSSPLDSSVSPTNVVDRSPTAYSKSSDSSSNAKNSNGSIRGSSTDSRSSLPPPPPSINYEQQQPQRIERSPMSPSTDQSSNQSPELYQLQSGLQTSLSPPQRFSVSPAASSPSPLPAVPPRQFLQKSPQPFSASPSPQRGEMYPVQVMNGSPQPFRFSKSPGVMSDSTPFSRSRSSQSPTSSNSPKPSRTSGSPRIVKMKSQSSTDSSDTTNKDFRKSILNMSENQTNGCSKQSSMEGSRSRSSSADFLDESDVTAQQIVQTIVDGVIQDVTQINATQQGYGSDYDNNNSNAPYDDNANYKNTQPYNGQSYDTQPNDSYNQYNPFQTNHFMYRAFNNDQIKIRRYRSPTPTDSEWLGACFTNDNRQRDSPHGKTPTPIQSPMSPAGSRKGLSKPNTPDSLNRIKSPSKPRSETGVKSPEDGIFISHRYRDIDDILGFVSFGPVNLLKNEQVLSKPPEGFQEVSADQVKIHEANTYFGGHLPARTAGGDAGNKFHDAAIQVYKNGDYGNYLDLELSLNEQMDELEGICDNRKNGLVVRTQLGVRVHSIIDTLLKSNGRELRKALFTLKQIFQEDKDLVHGFVSMGGLSALTKIGKISDINYQNYILRTVGQVMLYVDGMNGVVRESELIKWIYSLIATKHRLVMKTALKLLLIFVEYADANAQKLVNVIKEWEGEQRSLSWSSIISLLKDYENIDTEVLVYATTLINKTLAGLKDQDAFYDETDVLEYQGMEGIIQYYASQPGTDLDLLDQLQLYDMVLKYEDGEIDSIQVQDSVVGKTPRLRSSFSMEPNNRRKSFRHSLEPILQSQLSSPLIQHQDILRNRISFHNGGGPEMSPQPDCYLTSPFSNGCVATNGDGYNYRDSVAYSEIDGGDTSLETEPASLERNKGADEEVEYQQTVKDITAKLNNLPLNSPPPVPNDERSPPRFGDMGGLILKTKEELMKNRSKSEIYNGQSTEPNEAEKIEERKSETDIQWEELVNTFDRELILCDLDFTDLTEADDTKSTGLKSGGSVIPPPPPPKLPGCGIPILAPPKPNNSKIQKAKKTVKLFWKEVRDDFPGLNKNGTIWDELPETDVDSTKLEFLFESRAKDALVKEKQQEMNKIKEIVVLDHKRSNAINIAITKLPPSRAIKVAIMKMDSSVVTRDGIEKLLSLLPTEEEKGKIQEAHMTNSDVPLGSAEQFLLTLSTIPELSARLKLWAFKMDFENIEREIAEPLMDLKQGIEILKKNHTFKCILATLRSIGIFLNGSVVKGFQIDYLTKVPEVKDTVQKHSLLHHLCHFVMESFPNTTDLYSEIGPITRASKADFGELAHNITYLETECKASWDRLRLVSKHDLSTQLKQKLFEFLTDSAERIIILEIVHRRILNRYRDFLSWLGIPMHKINETRPNEFCRTVSEFALEYRTTRERVQQQLENKANHRERNKTRGKLIVDIDRVSYNNKEDKADVELRHLLETKPDSPVISQSNGTATWRRRKADSIANFNKSIKSMSYFEGEDELLETLVKTATKTTASRTTPRERKRTRNADRKSLKRSRTREGYVYQRSSASPH